MGNVLGNFFGGRKEAQKLTAEIENATSLTQPESLDNTEVNKDGEAAGQMVTEVIESTEENEPLVNQDAKASEPVAEEVANIPLTEKAVEQASEELLTAEEHVGGLKGYADEVSPAVEAAELVHEQDLVQIEDNANRGGAHEGVGSFGVEDTNLSEAENSDIPANMTAEIDKIEAIGDQYDQTVSLKFVKNERAIAEGTMAAVDRVTSDKEAKLVDILALYEQSANAMHEIDERVA